MPGILAVAACLSPRGGTASSGWDGPAGWPGRCDAALPGTGGCASCASKSPLATRLFTADDELRTKGLGLQGEVAGGVGGGVGWEVHSQGCRASST